MLVLFALRALKATWGLGTGLLCDSRDMHARDMHARDMHAQAPRVRNPTRPPSFSFGHGRGF